MSPVNPGIFRIEIDVPHQLLDTGEVRQLDISIAYCITTTPGGPILPCRGALGGIFYLRDASPPVFLPLAPKGK